MLRPLSMLLFLPLFGCAGDEPRVLEDIDDFFRGAAEIACTQVIACEPESWLALHGQASCELEQRERLEGMFGHGGGTDDLDHARQCLDDMAVLGCNEQVVDGFIPPVCWSVRQWDEPLIPEEFDGERPPG